jgi:hypothetical protein
LAAFDRRNRSGAKGAKQTEAPAACFFATGKCFLDSH